jgi:hypothetical protein
MSSKQPGSGAQSSQGNAQHDESSTSVGGATSGKAGATRHHETMAETGGSGGGGLTRNDVKEPQAAGKEAGARQSAGNNAPEVPARPAGGGPGAATDYSAGGPVADSGARGFQDTRSEQAGGSGTGLGTPETGANQTEDDIERGGKRNR